MKDRHVFIILVLFIGIASLGFGCASPQPNLRNAQPAAAEPKLTKITKDTLKTRLAGKNVQIIETRPENEKPNPLFLTIKIDASGADGKSPMKVTLNNEAKQSVGDLVAQLQKIFKSREQNGVFREGKNEIDKRVNISASESDIAFYNKENIYVEDLEKLVDDLHKADINEIYVDFTNAGKTMAIEDLKPPPAKK